MLICHLKKKDTFSYIPNSEFKRFWLSSTVFFSCISTVHVSFGYNMSINSKQHIQHFKLNDAGVSALWQCAQSHLRFCLSLTRSTQNTTTKGRLVEIFLSLLTLTHFLLFFILLFIFYCFRLEWHPELHKPLQVRSRKKHHTCSPVTSDPSTLFYLTVTKALLATSSHEMFLFISPESFLTEVTGELNSFCFLWQTPLVHSFA